VVAPRWGGAAHAIECKWQARKFDPSSLAVFRRAVPEGRNVVVAGDVVSPYDAEIGGHLVTVCGPTSFGSVVATLP
jgi:hypothetical protein